jgi:uncharacterized protein
VKSLFVALGCGLLFGVGLCISGMTDPANILAFLDVSGAWSPNLAGVMFGAIAVHASWLRWTTRRGAVGAKRSTLAAVASGKRVDGALVGGAALFGVGWGVSGYCPGPAIVALGSGALGAVVFVAAMSAGMLVSERVKERVEPAMPPDR